MLYLESTIVSLIHHVTGIQICSSILNTQSFVLNEQRRINRIEHHWGNCVIQGMPRGKGLLRTHIPLGLGVCTLDAVAKLVGKQTLNQHVRGSNPDF